MVWETAEALPGMIVDLSTGLVDIEVARAAWDVRVAESAPGWHATQVINRISSASARRQREGIRVIDRLHYGSAGESIRVVCMMHKGTFNKVRQHLLTSALIVYRWA